MNTMAFSSASWQEALLLMSGYNAAGVAITMLLQPTSFQFILQVRSK
jgi:hypothetical protein